MALMLDGLVGIVCIMVKENKMKKILTLCLVLISLSSCNLVYNAIDTITYSQLDPIEFYDFAEYDLTRLNNFYQIAMFQQKYLTYTADIGEDINSPEEAMRTGIADCDEFSIGFLDLAYVTLGIKMSLIVVSTKDYLLADGTSSRAIVNGGIGNHFDVRYEGINYDAQVGCVSPYQNVLYEYTFDEIFGGGY